MEQQSDEERRLAERRAAVEQRRIASAEAIAGRGGALSLDVSQSVCSV